MNRKIVVLPVALAIIGAVVLAAYAPDADDDTDDVRPSPVSVTKYEHRLGENVFLQIGGLEPDDRGTIGIFTPEGLLYRSFEYDGAAKHEFNHYFFPDTSRILGVCTPEQLIGVWEIIDSDGAYEPVEFEMTDQYIQGGEDIVTTVC